MRILSTLRPVSLALIALGLVAASVLIVAPFVTSPERIETALPGLLWSGDDGGEPDGAMLPGVFTYQQQRSLSCEYASLAIATGLLGRPVSEYVFDDLVPASDNPHWGYRGDIEGIWGNTDDYGVYIPSRWPRR